MNARRMLQTLSVEPRSVRHFAWLGALSLFTLVPLALLAQQTKAPLGPTSAVPARKGQATEPAQSSGTHALTADDLSAFLDGLMPLQLQREDIAGAVIVVVKDGKTIFAKGYGYSNVEKRTPVSPENTLFRPGSISKLFNWTSIMQQVEQGKLDLDRDVNDYLDFKIPATFPKPITLRNAMTHTPGFEETVQMLFVKDASQLTPLGQYLPEHLPERIFPPGTTPAYSNYATAMAGYILQRVSGESFDDYIDNHIFHPLGMMHCTVRQPLPAALKDMMSNGYSVASQPAKPFEFVEASPAGSSSVTGAEMAHFMIAHLQDGKYENTQILRPETARLMHSRQFENMPEMNAMALGFYEETRNGHRIIGHGGDTEVFHSDLHLILDQGVGFFVSYNSAGKGEISPREALWHAFLDRYYPYEPPPAAAPANAAADAQLVSGRYLSSRRADTTIIKVSNVAGQPKVYSNSDGTISVNALKDLNGQPKKFQEIGPLIFREVHGQEKVGFKRDDKGNLVLVIDFPFFVFERTPANENTAFQAPLIIAALVILVLTLLLWPIAALLRKHYRHPLSLTPQQRRLRLLVRLTCLLDVLFVAVFIGFFSMAEKDIGILSPRFNPMLRIIQLVGWLGVLGTILALINALRSWREQGRWWMSKLGDLLIALACVGFVWFVFTWNMLHWSLRY
ncbi:MAG TPA: serine hydrolase domain-containing protein [Candidatus Sulfotelmatobacter sp.]|nr:serine hydrolase domain-containing protein [Candidatus Sulfotelmatobacter sp.]